ncbi:DUF5063 domain-containing protein [Maribellus comscasis]|uniref:DUF5063 domain-containing protein n=1 Tax=Maribellus comscasis TaxID=2681766 RepID=A0A6I6JXN9_9BACT|nr:DUF5063 domain-containing protein [Maribellus comscasis]QGY47321.1 DUF5063 domain-containing protein [Maribellus comscasis]
MEDKIHELVYSKTVIEFVTVANEFCRAIEAVNKFPVMANLQKVQKILPLLYLKTTMLPKTERVLDDELEKYVSELDYNVLHQKWLQALGEHDSFYEVFDPSIQFGQETMTASIAENLMDIYQSLKDFLMAYSMGNDEVMNDALFQCSYSFEEYWGQNLVNVLRAVHQLVYGDVDFDEADDKEKIKPGSGNPKWLDEFWGTGTDEDE